MNDLDFLVAQTFEGHAPSTSGKFGFDVPNSPGVIYQISTEFDCFRLRVQVSENLQRDFAPESPEGYDSPTSIISFFATEYRELAQHIFDQVRSKRFWLKNQVHHLGLDVSGTWWMESESTHARIYFERPRHMGLSSGNQSFNGQCSSEELTLGPLYDPMLAAQFLSRFKTGLCRLFGLRSWEIDQSTISFSWKDPRDMGAISLLKMFSSGDEFGLENIQQLGADVYYFFKEIVALRKFWIQVQNQLRQPPIHSQNFLPLPEFRL